MKERGSRQFNWPLFETWNITVDSISTKWGVWLAVLQIVALFTASVSLKGVSFVCLVTCFAESYSFTGALPWLQFLLCCWACPSTALLKCYSFLIYGFFGHPSWKWSLPPLIHYSNYHILSCNSTWLSGSEWMDSEVKQIGVKFWFCCL